MNLYCARQFDTSQVGARLGQGLGQGPGKVWINSKVRAGLGWQGLGKVGASLGQGLDKKQGSGKVGAS